FLIPNLSQSPGLGEPRGLGVKRFGEPFQPELRNKRVKGTQFFKNLVLIRYLPKDPSLYG
ncbi:hypothetical protein, partial [Streptococcus sp. DD11]|uniref:hypothetical protein n=1 Tax=Streptococcus sp. DD11 TaxID=1777879 RepID=UPI0019CF50C8